MPNKYPAVVATALINNPTAIVTDLGVELPSQREGGRAELLVSYRNLLTEFEDKPETVQELVAGIVTSAETQTDPVVEVKQDEQPAETVQEIVQEVTTPVVEAPKAKPGPKPKAK